jgi:hypothetical protein
MPFTAAQLVTGLNYAQAAFQKKEPIDQINIQHVALDWLVKNKEASSFTGGSFKEPLFVANGSNYQNYWGPDQVTYNERDPAVWTDFPWYNNHDGFWFDEDRLLAAGITLQDGADAIPSATEKEALLDLGKQSYRALRLGIQENLAYEMYRDGSQSTKACPGFASIIDPTPTVGTVGGINAATYSYWQNNANLTFTAANVIAEMEEMWAACIRYGGMKPTKIVCGRAYYDNFIAYSAAAVQRHQAVQGTGGVKMDATIEAANFHGVPVEWDPTLDALDTLLSVTTNTKTCYFLHERAITLRPVKGNWMVNRRPERLPDRYVHYFGQTSKYSLTSSKRNALAVMSIA